MTQVQPARKRCVIGVRSCFALIAMLLICIDLAAQSVEPIEHVIHVKFKPSYGAMVNNGNTMQRLGFKSLDLLNTANHVNSSTRIFPYAGKYEEAHRAYGLHLWYEIRVPADLPVTHFLQGYRNLEYFERVEECRKYSLADKTESAPILTESTNDPLFASQWHFKNLGTNGGLAGADIGLEKAWEIETGKSNVIVAVIDGGIDINHPDLKDAIWVNPDEIAGNGIDDDNNGYVDDVNGYGFAERRSAIFPSTHGTHVAGTIGAITNNSIGVSGIAGGSGGADGVRLMSCAVFGQSLEGGFPAAMTYAADEGAVISQNSWGGGSSAIEDAINYFIERAGFDNSSEKFKLNIQTGPMAGGIVIFAAGNDNVQDQQAGYPASLSQVLAVASTNKSDVKSTFSNYGTWVDISAPGEQVVSTLPGSSYGIQSGTSMSCPHVSGVAALIISKFGGFSFRPTVVSDRLLSSADKTLYNKNPVFTGLLGTGRLNANKALQNSDAIPPAAIADLRILNTNFNGITFGWTSPASGASSDPIAYVDLRYSSSPITEGNFNAALILNNYQTPRIPGTQDQATVKVSPGANQYFAMKTRDAFDNVSALSNVVVGSMPTPPQLTKGNVGLVPTLFTGQIVTRDLPITNSGESDLLVKLTVPANVTWVSVDTVTRHIQGNTSTNIPIVFNATRYATSSLTSNVTMKSNDPTKVSTTIPIGMTVITAPNIQITTQNLDFAQAYVGQTKDSVIRISNTGFAQLTINNVASDNPRFQVLLPTLQYQPDMQRTFTISFSPLDQSDQNGNITITSNDPDEGVATIKVHGRGTAPATVQTNPLSVQVTLNPNASVTSPFMISNSGAGSLDWQATVLSGDFVPGTGVTTASRLALKYAPGVMANLAADPETGLMYGQFFADQLGGNNHYQYNPVSDTWKALTPNPYSLNAQLGIYHQGEVYRVHVESSPRKFSIYSIRTDSWRSVQMPYDLEVGTIVSDGTYIYGMVDNKLYRCETTSMTWTQLANAPLIFSDMGGLAYFQGVLYGHIGGVLATPSETTPFFKYYIATNQWEVIAEMPGRALAGAAIDPSNRLLHVATWDNMIGIYDIDDNQWSSKPREGVAVGNVRTGVTFNTHTGVSGLYAISIDGTFGRFPATAATSWLSVAPTNGVLGATSSQNLILTLNSSAMVGGEYSGQIKLQSRSNPGTFTLLPVTMTVTGTPRIWIDRVTDVFPQTFVNETRQRKFNLKNIGSEPLHITSIVSGDPQFVPSNSSFNLQPNQTANLTVDFKPTAVDVFHTTLSLISDDPINNSLQVDLTAEGVDPPIIDLSPATINASTFSGNRIPIPFTISNNGGSDLNFKATAMLSRLSVSPSEGVVHPGESQVVNAIITTYDLSPGNYPGSIKVTYDPLMSQDLPVTVSVVAAAGIAMDRSAVEFGQVASDKSKALSVFVSNRGTNPLTITSITSDDSHFKVDDRQVVIQPGNGLSVVTTFVPTLTGDFNGGITITSDDPDNNTVLIPVHGVGVAAPVAVISPSRMTGFPSIGQDVTGSITIKNTGGSDLVWGLVYLPFWVEMSSISGVVAPMSETRIDVKFQTSRFSAGGNPNDILAFDSNAANGRQSVVINFVVGASLLMVDATDISVVTGHNSVTQQNVTMRNTGNADLSWNIAPGFPAWISFDKSSGQIAAGAIDQVSVNFDGSKVSGPGKYQGTIVVTAANSGGSRTINVTMTVLTNRPPTVKSVIPRQVMRLGTSSTSVDVDKVFVDPDGDPVTLTAKSTDQSALGTQLNGSTITLSPQAEGVIFVDVTATDPFGANTSMRFTTTVLSANGTFTNPVITGLEKEETLETMVAVPNPFEEEVSIMFDTRSAGNITLSLYDNAGKQVLQRQEYIANEGRQRIPIDGSLLSPGIYYARLLKDGKWIASIRIIKL